MRHTYRRIFSLLLVLLLTGSMLLATACGDKPIDNSTPDDLIPDSSGVGDSTTDGITDDTTDGSADDNTDGTSDGTTDGIDNSDTTVGNSTTGNSTGSGSANNVGTTSVTTVKTSTNKPKTSTTTKTNTTSTTKTTRPSNVSTVSRPDIFGSTTKAPGNALMDYDSFMAFFNECVAITEYKVTDNGTVKTSGTETAYLYSMKDDSTGAEYCMHLYCDKNKNITAALLSCNRKNYEFMFAVFSYYIYQSLNLPEIDLSEFLDKFESLPAANIFDKEKVGVYNMRCFTPDEFVTFSVVSESSNISNTTQIKNKMNEVKCKGCMHDPERITNYMAVSSDAASLGIRMDMLDKALVNLGNQARLAKLMNKAKNGEDITYVAIGGSVTEGAYASDYRTKSYAGLTHKWLQNTFPQSDVTFINAGIGGTSSLYGVHRIEEDVLKYDPDLVIIEFGVNDTTHEIQYEAYSSLLRRVLEHESQPAVLILFVMGSSGSNQQIWQQPIAEYYDLPIISYRDAVWPEVNNKDNIYGQYLWEDICADYVHPTDKGHAIIGNLITSYLQKTYENLSKISTTVPALPAPERPYVFENAEWLTNKNTTPQSMGSFTVINQNNSSWKSTGNKPIVFKVNAKRVIIPVPATLAENLNVTIRIDGGTAFKMEDNLIFGGGRYSNFLVLDEDAVGEHTIEITCNSGTLYLGGLFVS